MEPACNIVSVQHRSRTTERKSFRLEESWHEFDGVKVSSGQLRDNVQKGLKWSLGGFDHV